MLKNLFGVLWRPVAAHLIPRDEVHRMSELVQEYSYLSFKTSPLVVVAAPYKTQRLHSSLVVLTFWLEERAARIYENRGVDVGALLRECTNCVRACPRFS